MDKKKQQKRRATCVGAFQAEAATNEPNNPPIADLIHFSSSPSDDEKEAAMGEENEWMDERGEEDRFGGWERGQTDRHEGKRLVIILFGSFVTRIVPQECFHSDSAAIRITSMALPELIVCELLYLEAS